MSKKFSLLRPIIAILILFIPLYPKFPLTNVTGTYVAIRLDDIVVALSVLLFLIYQIKNHFPFLKNKSIKLFLPYFLAIITSTVTAILIYQTDPKNILILNLFRRFEYISLFFITVEAIRKISDLHFTYYLLLVTTFFVSLYGYGQKYYHFPVISTMNSEFSKGQLLEMNVWTRISATFAGHYDLAAFMSVALIIILGIGLITKNKILKLVSLAVWLPAFFILTFTASRISTVAFWGGAVLTLILIRKYLWILPISLLFFLSVLNSSDLSQRLLATIPALKSQLLSLNRPTSPPPTPHPITTPTPITIPTPGTIAITLPTPAIIHHGPIEETQTIDADAGVARSGEIRFNVEWPRAITAFHKNIITGTGLGSITLATDNDFLRLLGESGLLGLISFISIMVYFIIKTIKIYFQPKTTNIHLFTFILLGGLMTTLVNGIFIDVFEASKPAYLFWIMMGIYYQVLEFSDHHQNDKS
jgi:hypothetical protein